MGVSILILMMSTRACLLVSLAVLAVIGGSAHQFQDTFEENDVVVPEMDLLQDEFLSRFNRGRGTLPESEFIEDEYGSHEETDGSIWQPHGHVGDSSWICCWLISPICIWQLHGHVGDSSWICRRLIWQQGRSFL